MDRYYKQEMHLCCFEPLDLGIVCHYSITQPILIDTSTRLRDGIYIIVLTLPPIYMPSHLTSLNVSFLTCDRISHSPFSASLDFFFLDPVFVKVKNVKHVQIYTSSIINTIGLVYSPLYNANLQKKKLEKLWKVKNIFKSGNSEWMTWSFQLEVVIFPPKVAK